MSVSHIHREYPEGLDIWGEDEKKTELDLQETKTNKVSLEHLSGLEKSNSPARRKPLAVSRIDGDAVAIQDIPKEDLSELFSHAVKTRDVDKVRTLLKVDKVRTLLKHGDIAKYCRNALLVAVQEKQVDIVKMLLEEGNISASACGWALREAAYNGDKASAAELLKREDISAIDRGLAFRNACTKPSYAIRVMLLERGGMSVEDRSNGLSSAAMFGNVDILQMLLEPGDISAEARGKALSAAAANGHVFIVQTLLKPGDISAEVCSSALRDQVARDGLEGITEALLEYGNISAQDYIETFHAAVKNRRAGITETLIKHGNIPAEDCSKALQPAAKGGHADVIEALLECRDIPAEDYSKALQSAVKGEHVDTIQALLTGGFIRRAIPIEDHSLALRAFAYCDAKDYIVDLLKQEDISKSDFRRARTIATKAGHPDVIEAFNQYASRYAIVDCNGCLIQ